MSRVPTPGPQPPAPQPIGHRVPRSSARAAEYAALTAHRARIAGEAVPTDLVHDMAYVAFRTDLTGGRA
jgi:hypothetical protein